jgi:hypothetical protein
MHSPPACTRTHARKNTQTLVQSTLSLNLTKTEHIFTKNVVTKFPNRCGSLCDFSKKILRPVHLDIRLNKLDYLKKSRTDFFFKLHQIKAFIVMNKMTQNLT